MLAFVGMFSGMTTDEDAVIAAEASTMELTKPPDVPVKMLCSFIV